VTSIAHARVLAESEEPTTQTVDADPADGPAKTTVTMWHRAGLAVLLVATAATYLWNITINGMGNQFYAAAAQAGSTNWEALLFGSLDPHNFITVDKPPVSQWVMGLSGQIFGFSSASMLIPEALMAVAAVALLYGAVTRVCGPNAGLLAGTAFAATPVAALMFRFNNPDAVMVLLMMAAAYCTIRALQRASTKWLVLAGVCLGFAFLAKMLEGLMVMPAIGLAYLVAAPTPLRRRLLQLLATLAAFVVSAGWFVVLTMLWPESSRPYIAGSTDNTFMDLVLGYNGFARVLGRNHGGGFQPPAARPDGPVAHLRNQGGFGGFGNQTQGVTRLFSGEFGFEIGWLVPAALLATVLVIVARWRAPRVDLVRGAAILFGGWLVVDGLVLSFMHGTIHPYYCLSLAPAVAAMFAIGVQQKWATRDTWLGRIGMGAMLLATGGWSFWLLRRNADWLPGLRWSVVALAVLTAAVVLVAMRRRRDRVALVALVGALVVALAGSTAYAVATISQPHTGGGPMVGPAESARADNHGGRNEMGWAFGQNTENPQLESMLSATRTDWSAAINRSSAAANLELKTHTAVMAIGGFSGSDPVPTLSQFQQYVRDHRVTYYIVTANRPGNGPRNLNRAHSDIADWVAATYPPIKVGDDTAYDLTGPPKT
jgi:4-amino-4-deoxy-L-arabinose transferase-like glycosyltransferase